jgi:hypothetical protein
MAMACTACSSESVIVVYSPCYRFYGRYERGGLQDSPSMLFANFDPLTCTWQVRSRALQSLLRLAAAIITRSCKNTLFLAMLEVICMD